MRGAAAIAQALADKGLALPDVIDMLRVIEVNALQAAAAPIDTAEAREEDRRRRDRERKRLSRVSADTQERPSMECPQTTPAPVSPNDSITLTPSSPTHPVSDAKAVAPKAKPDEVRRILSEVVSDETAGELIAHRKAIKAPLTNGAAKGLVRDLSACGDPEAAASTLMARGWRTIRPDWNQPRAGPAAAASKTTNGYYDHLPGRKHDRHRHDRPNQSPPDEALGGGYRGGPTLDASADAGGRGQVFHIEGFGPERGGEGGLGAEAEFDFGLAAAGRR